jgi:parvulin-like peptidyl-prolyl isomerase
MNVNDEEVIESYQKNKDRYIQPETRRVLELLVSDRKLAEKLITQIQAGEDMQDLVRRYSIRCTREQDAAQGVLLTKNTWGKIGEVVFSLPVGGLYGPIDLDSNRFSIVRLQEIINNGYRPFEDVRWEVKEEILKQKSREQTERILKENSGKYSIKIKKNALKDVEALKSTMVVRKSHFPNRFAVPLTTPTDHQASWFQHIWNNQEK